VDRHPTDFAGGSSLMQTAVKAKKPRKQAVSGRFWAMRTYRERIKDDHKIEPARSPALFDERLSKYHLSFLF
jgi:hypothetical protein